MSRSTETQLEVIGEDLAMVRNANVLVVDDIIDTGNTLRKFITWLKDYLSPKTVGVAALLERRNQKTIDGEESPEVFYGDFVGFSIPSGFVVGFGLDYNEYFRDLEHVCLLNNDKLKTLDRSFQRFLRGYLTEVYTPNTPKDPQGGLYSGMTQRLTPGLPNGASSSVSVSGFTRSASAGPKLSPTLHRPTSSIINLTSDTPSPSPSLSSPRPPPLWENSVLRR